MAKKKSTKTSPRMGTNINTTERRSSEVSAEQVVKSLSNLFEHLGVEVAFAVPQNSLASNSSALSHTLHPHASAIGALLTTWHQDPKYLDEDGNPADLKLRGKAPSFRALARRKVPALDESFLLSELERLGVISINDSTFAHLHMRSFPIYEDKRLAVQHTLASLDAFVKMLRHNLDSSPSNSEQLFHRVAWNPDVDQRKIQALKIRMKRQGQSFLETLDDWLMRNAVSKTRKPNECVARAKVSVGVYLSVE